MSRLLAPALFASLIALAACGSKSSTPPSEPSTDGTAKACVKGGCSGTMCTEEGQDMMTTCEWRDEYACYQTATCERQADGACGWTQTDELTACLASPPPPPDGAAEQPM